MLEIDVKGIVHHTQVELYMMAFWAGMGMMDQRCLMPASTIIFVIYLSVHQLSDSKSRDLRVDAWSHDGMVWCIVDNRESCFKHLKAVYAWYNGKDLNKSSSWQACLTLFLEYLVRVDVLPTEDGACKGPLHSVIHSLAIPIPCKGVSPCWKAGYL